MLLMYLFIFTLQETLQNSPDYKDMSPEKAYDDFTHKIQHYLEQYEPMNAKAEPQHRFIQYINDGEKITTHRITGHLEAKILTFLTNFKPCSKTFYFSRVSANLKHFLRVKKTDMF